jgi:phenylalanyl-tRNA synthetase beta chain
VFDVYQGAGIEPGHKSIALEVSIAPKDKTLTEAEIEALSAKIIAAAQKAGGRLRV